MQRQNKFVKGRQLSTAAFSLASSSQDEHKVAAKHSSISKSFQRFSSTSLLTWNKVQLFILLISSITALTPNTLGGVLRWPAIDLTQAKEVSNSTANNQPEQQQATFRLDCQPGEQRQFSYESSTKVWGSSNQQVRLRATLRLKCMEPPTNTTLKYLAEVVSLEPNFIGAHQQQEQQPSGQQSSRLKSIKDASDKLLLHASSTNGKSSQSQRVANLNLKRQQLLAAGDLYWSGGQPHVARAEPIFEEVGEVASRVKRSVSGWLSKAWVSVKDFFGNIFTSSERTSITREQAFKETGLDIAGQCKAPSGAGGSSSKGRLPFDDSVFDDLGPEYYVGASSLDAATAYEFSSPASDDDDDDEIGATLSFFDDPKPIKVRTRRATTSSSSSSKQGGRARAHFGADLEGNETGYNKLLRLPFVFLQSRQGKIVEVRFSGDETDLSVKNFKRHLCDLFATNLDANKATATNEVSPIGKHQTKYTVDSSANSIDTLKQSIIKSVATDPTASGQAANHQQLVRVLAMVGSSGSGGNRNAISGGNQGDQHKYDDDDDGLAGADDDELVGSGGAQKRGNGEGNVSVLRTINTTSSIQVSAGIMAPNIDRMDVRVKQVQQINEGRLIGTAGQMSMSLVQASQSLQSQQQQVRLKRESNDSKAGSESRPESGDQKDQIEDIADLLQVSTSFSLQLVPIPRNADGSISDSDNVDEHHHERDTDTPTSRGRSSRRSRRSSTEASSTAATIIATTSNGTTTTSSTGAKQVNGTTTTTTTKRTTRKRQQLAALVKSAPSDSLELQRVLQEWRKQEARLQMSATKLIAENGGRQDSEQQRLDVMRDQIRMRLNEEFVRNRIRRSLTVAAAASRHRGAGDTSDDGAAASGRTPASGGGDLGLGLTQLVLGNGITSKRKGPIYATIEEVMELEASLANDQSEAAISRLMRDTIRVDKLREHCASSVPSLDELYRAYKRPRQLDLPGSDQLVVVEKTLPFGFRLDEQTKGESDKDADDKLHDSDDHKAKPGGSAAGQRSGKSRQTSVAARANEFERKNDRKFEQCRSVLQLMLKLNDKQAINLVLDLLDECNQRLLLAAKSEELGYGPASKYYRRLRQQLIELLPHLSRPTDALIDKLLARLHYPKLGGDLQQQPRLKPPTSSRPRELPEFVYVNTNKPKQALDGGAKYNKSLLKDEDDFNNNDGAALLVMTLTSLASKSSVSRLKRVELVDKLLASLKGTSCALFNSPDLDIIESMANFQEPLDEIVGRLVSLAKRCKQHDQYVIACIHGLSGQLNHAASQRFLNDQLKSSGASCAIKSEIMLTLIGAQLNQALANTRLGVGGVGGVGGGAQHQSNAANSTGMLWPSYGINKLDETLMDLIEGSDKEREPDRRCLRQLVAHYFSRKHNNMAPQDAISSQQAAPSAGRSSKSSPAARHRRAVVNENNFWDESQCKRWTVPADLGADSLLPNDLMSILTGRNQSSADSAGDLIDEIDDNSIVTALLNQHQRQQQRQKGSRSYRGRTQRLVERELDQAAVVAGSSSSGSLSLASNATSAAGNQTGESGANYLRRRYKCVASKNFGPKNAQARLSAEIVNDLIGAKDENKFLARFRLSTEFLGNRIDVGRMYLWHQRRTTRAYANILGRSIWDTSHGCKDKPPSQTLYMPLFDFNLWLVKVSVGLRLSAEMGFFSNCQEAAASGGETSGFARPEVASGSGNRSSARTTMASDELLLRQIRLEQQQAGSNANDELQLYPTVALKAAGEATAKLVVARAGMNVASQCSYQGSIQVSRQPDSCMSIYSAHQPMNITFSSWFQLWDNDCHFWGSRNKAEPRATKWSLNGRKPMAWLEDECLTSARSPPSTTPPPTNSTS